MRRLRKNYNKNDKQKLKKKYNVRKDHSNVRTVTFSNSKTPRKISENVVIQWLKM